MTLLLGVLAVLFAASTLVCAGWALRERARAQAVAEAPAQAALIAQTAGEEMVRKAETALQQRLEAQLKPVSETLARFEAQVRQVEAARLGQAAELKTEIGLLRAASTATRAEASKLSQALRRGAGVQGRWGEEALRNVLQMSGLNPHYDFVEQPQFVADGAAHRPDVVVRLPGGGLFVIDSKCSLTAYLEAADATDEEAREACLVRHAQSLRGHLKTLADRAYWDKLDGSPDFVAMFVPGDGILAAALERAPELLATGMDRNVIVTTPTTLFALCKAVAYGWRVEAQGRSVERVMTLGRELHDRLATMAGHVAKMGQALTAAVAGYNAFVGSLESRVMPKAREFDALGLAKDKALPELEPLEMSVRLTAPDAPPTSPE